MNPDTSKLAFYQAKNGAIELTVDAKQETIWATQAQMAEVFAIDRSVITKHINNIYKENELAKSSTCAKIAQVQKEGARIVSRNIDAYNLDVIISVGYRVNSKRATAFRQWATKTLKSYISYGFVIDTKLVQRNYGQFLQAIDDTKLLSASDDDSSSISRNDKII